MLPFPPNGVIDGPLCEPGRLAPSLNGPELLTMISAWAGSFEIPQEARRRRRQDNCERRWRAWSPSGRSPPVEYRVRVSRERHPPAPLPLRQAAALERVSHATHLAYTGADEIRLGRAEAHRKNLSERGIGFDQAARIFRNSRTIEWLDERTDHGETRVSALSERWACELLHVVYTDRGDVRWIISARRASRRERSIMASNSSAHSG